MHIYVSYIVGDTIKINFTQELYEIFKNYNEFVIDLKRISEEILYSLDTKKNIGKFLNVPDAKSAGEIYTDSVFPVKDGKLSLQEFLDMGVILRGNILFKGNMIVADQNYHVKEGMTMEDLKIYFETVVERIKETEQQIDYCG